MSYETKVYRELAQLVGAYHRCVNDNDPDRQAWAGRHEDCIRKLVDDNLPHGSGFDSGCKLDIDKSTEEKLVIHTSFHHMDENGCYDGWTDHTITVRPSLAFDFTMSISGRDRNRIKEYMHEGFDFCLHKIIVKG